MRSVALERTGWRDQALSQRHREWGWNCPAVDLDFLMAEYNHGKPCALIEYKHKSARAPELNHPTYQTLIALANGYIEGPLPCFIARYDPETWAFRVTALNDAARAHYGATDVWLTEQMFVDSLYRLRKLVLTDNDRAAINRLNDGLPDDAFVEWS